MTGATALGHRQLRIDPDALPARWSVPAGQARDTAVYLDHCGVIVKRQMAGMPLTVSLPFRVYKGVAIRLKAGGDMQMSASVELLHDDAALTLTLATTVDLDAAADDWQRWSQELSLPMLLIEPNGRVTQLGPPATVPFGKPSPRRRRGCLARRPRFLVRRKMGNTAAVPLVYRAFRVVTSYE
jgi:hypothetical protein